MFEIQINLIYLNYNSVFPIPNQAFDNLVIQQSNAWYSLIVTTYYRKKNYVGPGGSSKSDGDGLV